VQSIKSLKVALLILSALYKIIKERVLSLKVHLLKSLNMRFLFKAHCTKL